MSHASPRDRAFRAACVVSMVLPLVLLGLLVAGTIREAAPGLGAENNKKILDAFVGSAALVLLTVVMAVPVGVGAALWLEEYAPPGRFTSLVERSIGTLAGVPSILHGLFGLVVFVRVFGLGRGVFAGAATLALVILPIVITTSREALRAVPVPLREACFALGADRLQALRHVVLPTAMPGILTGVVLSLARAAGTTAPLVALGVLASIPRATDAPPRAETVSALPLSIFDWLSRPEGNARASAALAILGLLALVLALHGLGLWLRVRFEKRSD